MSRKYEWGIADNAPIPHAWISEDGEPIITVDFEHSDMAQLIADFLNGLEPKGFS